MELQPQDSGIRIGSVGENHILRAEREFDYPLVYSLSFYRRGNRLGERGRHPSPLRGSLPQATLSGSTRKWQRKTGVGQVLALWRLGPGSLMGSEPLVLGGQRLSLFAPSPDTPGLPVPLRLYFVL